MYLQHNMRLFRNKRAVSIMVSYAILIVISVSVSIIMYPYLKSKIFADNPECPPDISLVVSEYECSADHTKLLVNISNRGLFATDGTQVTIKEAGKKIGKSLLLGTSPTRYKTNPGQIITIRANLSNENILGDSFDADTNYEIEIQPIVVEDGLTVTCTNAIITQPISCS